MIGTVYLLHLEPGLPVTGSRVARHYLGWTAGEDVQQRLDQHLAGRGSPLVAAVIAAGGTATLVRTWPRVDRHFERRLKRRHEAPRLCPHCVAAGHTNGRGPLLTDRRPAPAEDDSAGAGTAPRHRRRVSRRSVLCRRRRAHRAPQDAFPSDPPCTLIGVGIKRPRTVGSGRGLTPRR